MSGLRSCDPIVITGIGLITGLGGDRESTWAALRGGKHAVDWLPYESQGLPRMAGCGASGFLTGEEAEEPVLGLAALAAAEALRDAGFDETGMRTVGGNGWDYPSERVATLAGLSKGGLRSLSRAAQCIERGACDTDLLARLWGELSWPDAAVRMIRNRFGFQGPSSVPVAACATGLVAVLQAADLIRGNVCDAALAGASDASLEPLILAAFQKMRVLARCSSDPGRAVRPWDRNRSGFLVGEGAAFFVLERASQAARRQVLPYAEIVSGMMGSEAYHLTDQDPDPGGLARLISLTLNRGGVQVSDIDHVNVHGTATRSNDPLECQAIRRALGGHADLVSCTASKPQVGHLLGAAGAVELAITCLSLRDSFVPPTLNLEEADSLCDLDGTRQVGRSRTIRHALKISLGFGGHMSTCLIRRTETNR